jgi:hypothetical protein
MCVRGTIGWPVASHEHAIQGCLSSWPLSTLSRCLQSLKLLFEVLSLFSGLGQYGLSPTTQEGVV